MYTTYILLGVCTVSALFHSIYASEADIIPLLTEVEKLVYPRDYKRGKLGYSEGVIFKFFNVKKTQGSALKALQMDSLFVHPLQEYYTPKLKISVQMACYAILNAKTREIVGNRYKMLQQSLSPYREKALAKLVGIQERLERSYPKDYYYENPYQEVSLCCAHWGYPQELIEVLYNYYVKVVPEYYATLVPVQDIVTCAQFGDICYIRGDLIGIMHDDRLTFFACPIVKEVLILHDSYDRDHRIGKICFTGAVAFEQPLNMHNSFEIYQFLERNRFSVTVKAIKYRPACRRL